MGDYEIRKSKTFRLFAVPSFFGGMAYAIDLFSKRNTINRSNEPKEADFKAIASDWNMVGEDMHFAIKTWEREHAKVAK